MKRRILMLVPYLPYPLNSGGCVRVYNLLKNLAADYEITFLCYLKDKSEEKNISYLEPYCQVHTILRKPAKSISNLLRWIFSSYPLMTIINGFCPPMEEKITTLHKKINFDLIHTEHYHFCQPLLHVKEQLKCPLLLGEQGVEYLVLERHLQTVKNPLVKWFGQIEVNRTKNYEIKTINSYDKFCEVSAEDLEIIKPFVKNHKSVVIPNGVDSDYFTPRENLTANNLIFVGTYRFFGNVDAMLYFTREVLPLVKKEVPDVKLYIVGNEPPKAITDLKSDSIIVTGFVADVRDYLKQSSVFVAPLRSGSGTKLKILEALSCGVPVVTSLIGSEGLALVNGQNAFITDAKEEFAHYVIQLLKDEKLNQTMGQAGRNLAADNYSWKASAQILSQTYQEMITRK